ncbi:unnamed protein product [Mycena citricolor]|uniref:Uncharacterized protein n=1 Tax=Mycena citricolor TaxID=2018698 RepID=A0AAD2HEY5_9AGAR|nr:unnamed protein product [Mycena citricolor]
MTSGSEDAGCNSRALPFPFRLKWISPECLNPRFRTSRMSAAAGRAAAST